MSGGGRSRRWLWLSFAGLASFAMFFLIRPFLDAAPAYRPRLVPGTTFAYSFLVLAAFVPYAVAARASRAGISLRAAAIAGGTLHLIVLFAPLTQSQDLYSYLFYGKMWAVHGGNPYTILPLSFASDPWLPWVQWRNQVSVYGPLWTLVSGGIARLAGGSIVAGFVLMKTAILAFGVSALTAVALVARDRGESPGRAVLLTVWNPLVIVSLPLGGHADVAVVAAVVWAIVADRRGRPILATLALTAASLVKAYAGVVLVVYLLALLRRSVRDVLAGAAAATGLTVLAWTPFWEGPSTLSGLGEIAARTSSSLAGTIQRLLEGPLDDAAGLVVRIAGAALVAAVVVVGARREGFSRDPWPVAAAAFLAYVAVTPWFLSWHLVGPFALAAVAGTAPIRAAAFTFSGTALLTAGAFGRYGQAALRYGPPAVAFALTRSREKAGTSRRWLRPPRPSAETPTVPPPAVRSTPPQR